MIETAILSILILVLLLASGFVSASETALFSLSPMRVSSFQESKDKNKRLVAKLVLHPLELFVTIFTMNITSNILLQNVTSQAIGEEGSWLLKIGIPLILILLFGDILPKSYALVNNVYFAQLAAPIIDFFRRVLRPVLRYIIMITNPLSRILFFFLKKEKDITKIELEQVVLASEKQGVLSSDEADLVTGYLDLQDKQVREVMKPREDVLFYDIHDPLTKLLHLFIDEECTRIPICKENLQGVLGVVSAEQFFAHQHDVHSPQDLIKFCQKPFFVPETTPATLLFRKFEEKKTEIALVVDEYGLINGLVTREDLVEEVIGEISDRRDDPKRYTFSAENVIIASGKLEIEEFEEIFDVTLQNPHNLVTLGGWITDRLGAIPKSGTEFKTDEFLFQILSAEPNRINRIYVRKLARQIKDGA